MTFKTSIGVLMTMLSSTFVPAFAADTVDPNPGAMLPPQVLSPLPAKYEADQPMRGFNGVGSLALAPNGRLWAAWMSGGDSEGGDNIVLVATSGDAGDTWTKPLLAIDGPDDIRIYDPAVWTDPDGKVWVFWAQSRKWFDGRAGVWCIVSDNADKEDAAWSEPRRLCDGVMINKPIVDSKGRWLFPVAMWDMKAGYPDKSYKEYTHIPPSPHTMPHGVNAVVSGDGGKTFALLGGSKPPKTGATFHEHHIVERKDGSFWMLMRTAYGIGETVSTDGGKTWTDPEPTALPHPSARFFIRRLRSGKLLLVKHGGMEKEPGKELRRVDMTAYLSDDDGKTWSGGFLLDKRGVSYPDGDQAADGTIFVTYDHGRTGDKEVLVSRFTEADVLAGKIVSPNGALGLVANKATVVTPPVNWRTGPKPLDYMAGPDKDAHPFRAGARARLELPGGAETDTFTVGVKLFANRDYKLRNYPKELEGKRFVRDAIEKTEATCLEGGVVYVLATLPERRKETSVAELLGAGFEKVAGPEYFLFTDKDSDSAALFQKEVKAGETIRFGKWGVLVY